MEPLFYKIDLGNSCMIINKTYKSLYPKNTLDIYRSTNMSVN